MVRDDRADLVYLTQKEKYNAIIDDIRDCVKRGQPVLVGTTSVEKSDAVAHFLNRRNIPHNVLNAKQHEREAHIVAEAGRPSGGIPTGKASACRAGIFRLARGALAQDDRQVGTLRDLRSSA
mgnify:CR=1 FL=1